jgi:hypothetical protein
MTSLSAQRVAPADSRSAVLADRGCASPLGTDKPLTGKQGEEEMWQQEMQRELQ